MDEPRLRTEIWVSAHLARLRQEAVPVYLLHRGDAAAGAVAVKLAYLDGTASLFTRHYGSEGHLRWQAEMSRVREGEVDAAVARRRAVDRDLWVLEIEDPRGRHLLEVAEGEE